MSPRSARGSAAASRARRNIGWIEECCRVPSGRAEMVGKPVVLRPWQREAIAAIYDNPAWHKARDIQLRPQERQDRVECFSVAAAPVRSRSASQLADVFCGAIAGSGGLAVRPCGEVRAAVARTAPRSFRSGRRRRRYLYPELGTFYKALSAEATTAFGLNPRFIVHDELGQVRGPRSHIVRSAGDGDRGTGRSAIA